MKRLLTLTAIFEAVTGLALIAIPSVTVLLLLGAALTEPSGTLVCRVTGAALLSLAIACCQSRDVPQCAAVVVKSFVFYNCSVALFLLYAVLVEHFSGIALWLVIFTHAGLAVWCVRSLLFRGSQHSTSSVARP
jgi:hypothetical protein